MQRSLYHQISPLCAVRIMRSGYERSYFKSLTLMVKIETIVYIRDWKLGFYFLVWPTSINNFLGCSLEVKATACSMFGSVWNLKSNRHIAIFKLTAIFLSGYQWHMKLFCGYSKSLVNQQGPNYSRASGSFTARKKNKINKPKQNKTGKRHILELSYKQITLPFELFDCGK